jgi:hypothetical protein
MEPTTEHPISETTDKAPAVVPPPIAPPAKEERLPARITAEQLLTLAPSDRRDNWIAQLVEVEVARQNYAYDRGLARDFAASGQFEDLKALTAEQAIATAIAKVQIGRGWGLNASDAIRYVYFTNGRPSLENQIIADKLQQAGFDWDIEWLEEVQQHKGKPWKKCVGCTLWLKRWNGQRYEPVVDRDQQPVSVSFSEADADHAMIWEKGKQIPLSEKWNFRSWGRDMYFWRCIGRLKKYHAPRILHGAVTREEALEMIPVESMPPSMLPKELQAPAGPANMPDAPAAEKRTAFDTVMGQKSFLDLPVEEEPAAAQEEERF